MIMGLGTDVVERARISDVLERHGNGFLKRVLTSNEFLLVSDKPKLRQVEFAAGRFAAKEALAKALGIGIGRLGLQNVGIYLTESGLEVLFQVRPASVAETDRFHISISHSESVAFAVAVWERV